MEKQASTILVVGGAGYIGSHVCKELFKNGYRPVCFDNLVYGHRGAVKWGPLETGDITDRSRLLEVFSRYKPDGVIHLAAYAYVGESVVEPAKYYSNNVAGTLSLLNAMRESDVSKIVFSSSCAVYGIPQRVPILEKESLKPVNPYGASKMMVERMLGDFSHAYRMSYVALRYFNAAGADPDAEIGEMHDPETHLIPLVLDVALGRRDELTVFGSEYPTKDGTCVRDYIHVADLARAHVLALKHLDQKGPVGLSANLGTGKGHSILDILRVAEEITGKKIKRRLAAPREGDPAELVADPSHAKAVLRWEPVYGDIASIIRHAWNFHQKSAGNGEAFL